MLTEGRSPIPEEFRRFRQSEWIEERPGPWSKRVVRAMRRWSAARQEWADEHGYSLAEMYEGRDRPVVVDRPAWRNDDHR